MSLLSPCLSLYHILELLVERVFKMLLFFRYFPAESPSSNDEAFNDVFVDDSSMGHCEQCGRLTEAIHHRGPKRFCSTSCARRYSVSCSRKMVAFHARTRGGRHSSANQLASDRKSSYSVPMVSSHCFCPQNHSPPISPRISI